jgi:hypothetical protein
MNETEILGPEVTPAIIAKELGHEWMGVFRYFPRLVNHLVGVALSDSSQLKNSIAKCKIELCEMLPKSLDESVPFVVRYLWNRSMDPSHEGFDALLKDYMDCVQMGQNSVSWTLTELRTSVCEIMKT